jgi:hypothetical protein
MRVSKTAFSSSYSEEKSIIAANGTLFVAEPQNKVPARPQKSPVSIAPWLRLLDAPLRAAALRSGA